MTLTKSRICYDLKESPYFCFVGVYKFFFSSPAHLVKFRKGLEANREWRNDSMKRGFKFDMDMELLADFSLYRKTETRGFLIINESTGVAYECPENIEFRGIVTS